MAESTITTDSIDSRHGTSDEFNDPYCDLCFDAKGLNVKVVGYCKDCIQFLCADCHVFHGKLKATRRHVVLREADMPQSQAEKPPRYDDCDLHQKHLKDQFCSEHKIMLCSLCASSEHNNCCVTSVEEACKTISASEIDVVYDSVNKVKERLRSELVGVGTHIEKSNEQKKSMHKDAEKIYNELISKADKLFNEMKTETETHYQSQLSILKENQTRLSDVIFRLESALGDIDQFKGKAIDVKVFLGLQDVLNYTNKCTHDVEMLNKAKGSDSLSFVPRKEIQDFLSSSRTLGSINITESKAQSILKLPEIVFPVSSMQLSSHTHVIPRQITPAESSPASQSVPLAQMKVTQQGSYNIKLPDDEHDCWITGLAILQDGRRLMTDFNNEKVKLFSRDMDLLCSLSLSDTPWDIAVMNDREVIVRMGNNSLLVLDVSGKQLFIKETINLPFNVDGITQYKDKLFVTDADNATPSVKLIDRSSKVYWSVSSDQAEKPLFVDPWYVTNLSDARKSIAVVTDSDNHTLTILNGETGEVIKRRKMDGKDPRGITTDTDDNVYVCYWNSHEIAVLTRDYSDERIILSSECGLGQRPQSIAYSVTDRQLIISYDMDRNDVDCYGLSE